MFGGSAGLVMSVELLEVWVDIHCLFMCRFSRLRVHERVVCFLWSRKPGLSGRCILVDISVDDVLMGE